MVAALCESLQDVLCETRLAGEGLGLTGSGAGSIRSVREDARVSSVKATRSVRVCGAEAERVRSGQVRSGQVRSGNEMVSTETLLNRFAMPVTYCGERASCRSRPERD